MRDFRRDGEFDLALSMFTSFGYFESEEEDLRVLSNVYGSLKPGGVFVMETMSKERLARIFLEATCREFEDGTMLVERHSVTGDWSRASNEWMIVRGEAVKRYRFSHTVYSGRELRERLEGAGFAEVMLYGNLEGAPYDQDATRLVIVARKH
jgi:SAM-dependent methyltransferase